jgi:hypothetical protein
MDANDRIVDLEAEVAGLRAQLRRVVAAHDAAAERESDGRSSRRNMLKLARAAACGRDTRGPRPRVWRLRRHLSI